MRPRQLSNLKGNIYLEKVSLNTIINGTRLNNTFILWTCRMGNKISLKNSEPFLLAKNQIFLLKPSNFIYIYIYIYIYNNLQKLEFSFTIITCNPQANNIEESFKQVCNNTITSGKEKDKNFNIPSYYLTEIRSFLVAILAHLPQNRK
ncbi:hypothetical protein RIR_jg41868.t1 [Rhizophagus irregularis DAOM 181602=DAOM 197198]|nr:hypothetical protein RIR_jg41868.t1 [Rhizophagus irregularis DAOM 181602=DAOM 197198]